MSKLEDLVRQKATEPEQEHGWSSEEVGAVAKNKREAIVVRINTRSGRRFVDIREFYWDRQANQYRPSKQGVSFDEGLLDELINLLNEARSRLGL